MSRIFKALKDAEWARASIARGVAVAGHPEAKPEPRTQSAHSSALAKTASYAKQRATHTKGTSSAAQTHAEHRKQKRAGMRLSARVRPADPKDTSFHEILATVNASRSGLYFVTKSKRFYPGMRLYVTFPYTSAHDSITGAEDNGEVVRLESLPDGSFGVAVVMRGPAQAARFTHSTRHASGRSRERRLATRYPFTATALVIEAHSDTRLQARCSDLSLEGCYLDTLNPFPEGTSVLLQVCSKGKTFESVARVTSSCIGMGMGLVFQEPAPEQTSVLASWLGAHHSGHLPAPAPHSQMAAQPAGTKQSAVPPAQAEPDAADRDRGLLVGLIRLLESNGVLKQAVDPAELEVSAKPIL